MGFDPSRKDESPLSTSTQDRLSTVEFVRARGVHFSNTAAGLNEVATISLLREAPSQIDLSPQLVLAVYSYEYLYVYGWASAADGQAGMGPAGVLYSTVRVPCPAAPSMSRSTPWRCRTKDTS